MTFDCIQPSYVSLRDQVSERTKRIVVWVGAGLSADAGMPMWGQLQSKLVEATSLKARSMDTTAKVQMEKNILSAVRENSPWIVFKRLKEILGETSYQDEIRKAFSTAASTPIPDAYNSIWKLRIQGLLNLNIDRIASRAFFNERPEASPIEFSGNQLAEMTHVLNQQRPFIVNLHGIVDSANTWVFTHDELNRLMKSKGYVNFLRSCISTHTILFLGLTAEDRAVGGHMEWFSKNGINTGPHYWLTDRADVDTDSWAERAKIRLIRYSNTDGIHSEVREFFKDLLSYVPKEDDAKVSPVISAAFSSSGTSTVPPVEELVREETEKIREVLNKRANEILSKGDEHSYEEYKLFCAEYDEAIHRAWYLSTRSGKNRLLGYEILNEVARGAFGQVYRAVDASGKPVAIKLLLDEVRKNDDLLRSFRRGVRSMRILSGHHSLGMVDYIDASEIPAFVAMEWIDGPNLYEAIKSKRVNGWEEILRIARDLAKIISSAHSLPERVLHRDLRPGNIMLKEFYSNPDGWEVVVLDFDLSWHRGAIERSVMHSTALGYLAPEQIQARPGISTRNAAVDSFGFGMTMFFLCTGSEPIPEQHKHSDWKKLLHMRIASRNCTQWKCLPARVARLIDIATQDEQSRRWDMGQIHAELEVLCDAIQEPSKVGSAEMMMEEIAANCEMLTEYEWNPDKGSAHIALPSGVTIELFGDEILREVQLVLAWGRTGLENRKTMVKSLPIVLERAVEKLRSGGWVVANGNVGMSAVLLEANVEIDIARKNVKKFGKALDAACEQLRVA